MRVAPKLGLALGKADAAREVGVATKPGSADGASAAACPSVAARGVVGAFVPSTLWRLVASPAGAGTLAMIWAGVGFGFACLWANQQSQQRNHTQHRR